MKQKTASFPLGALAAMVVLLIAARIAGVIYSSLATDILYADSAMVLLLSYIRMILSCTAFGVGLGATVTAVYAGGGLSAMLIHIGVLFFDAVAAFLIDWIGGTLGQSYLLAAAAVTNLLEWLFGALFAVLALGIARYARRHAQSPIRAGITAALAYMLGRLAMELVYLLQFLLEVDFQPYTREIVQIVGGFLQILSLYGGVCTLAAVAAVFLWRKKDDSPA